MLALTALALLTIPQIGPDIDRVVPKGTKPAFVVGGFQFLEGPVWTRENVLLWSDIKGDTIYQLQGGKAVPFLKPSHRAIGNTLDQLGRIVSCQQETRAVVRVRKDGAEAVLADKFEGKRFNGPDDVVVRSDGTVYFSDPGFALKPNDKELAVSAVYKVSPSGQVQLVAKGFNKPNGLAFSPDEKILYVNDTVKRQIRAFDVSPTGELGNYRLFAILTGENAGMANGMKVDVEGNVYCTGPGGIQIFTPTGKYVGLIFLAEVVNNFCFGGLDRKTLYIVTTHNLFSLKVKIPGAKYH